MWSCGGLEAGTDLDEPMRREELAQSRFDLREQAIGRGYPDDEVRALEASYVPHPVVGFG